MNLFPVLGFGTWDLGFPVPGRYPVPPPDLAADAPIANVLQPLCVNLLPMRGKELDQVIAHHSQGLFCFRVTQKPLFADAGLDRVLRFIWLVGIALAFVLYSSIGGRFQAFFPATLFSIGYYLA